MQRLRQQTRVHGGHAAAWLDEIELFVEMNAVLDAQALVEIEQIYAAAQEDVLAVVDGLPVCGVDGIGCSTPAEKAACFKEVDFKSGRPQGRRGCETRQATADDDSAGH